MKQDKTILNFKDKLLRKIRNIYTYLFGYKFFKPLNLFLVSAGSQALGINSPAGKGKASYLQGIDILIKKLVKKIDNKNNLFLDIGAHHGVVTKLVLDNTQNLNVMCYEPHPENYKKLSQSFKNEKRCKIFQYAVGSKIENKILFDWKKEGTGFASFYKEALKRHLLAAYAEVSIDFSATVDVVTLDSIKFENKVEFIKIDVEGNELEVLKGAKNSIQEHQPQYIVLEFGEINVESNVFLKNLIDFLNNYSSFRILPGGKILELNNPYSSFTHEVFGPQNLLFINNAKM